VPVPVVREVVTTFVDCIINRIHLDTGNTREVFYVRLCIYSSYGEPV
jgi:hypothetical protein